ncbi:hypothetical protein A6M27_03955 [Acidithiobacillus thiooxidans]|uniref:Uncharacterized protein n=1 Tax=Acidithiobacillus thiooxidans TaxID=930 RepID=A0A1C2ISU0_ACITH|nr:MULTISPECIES: hypothetical protein [Acidithiobacillus]MBU2835655.1 hypothetical protein [Acidithiobacillus thiooxidans]MDD5278023.1 hypothetical protein [Acidithiobacillus sp.]OCX72408.1 hypothetical protein A6P07_09895 [Acidithiobacillus thiooxidans]OCX74015.1 hypothetical protein A6M23_07150 [Acidithiobacillus thiooxidans]OCX78942.1 hypothetical protein A6O24_03160 [Acidithiobacillus thiooxidans]
MHAYPYADPDYCRLYRGENLGISNPKVPLSALRAHEIWAVLAKTLAEQNPSPHCYAERDGLILRYTKDARCR